MSATEWIGGLASRLTGKWIFRIWGVTLVCVGLSGCDPATQQPSTATPASPSTTLVPDPIAPNAAEPGEHVRTEGGTAVDVNPPGGGVHVNVPPGPIGDGVHVDIGPGGVNVTSPKPTTAP
jgi:hypothetical protein